MAFANPETYVSGEPAYDINMDLDDWEGLANVAQMRFGHNLQGSKFLGYEFCVSQPVTVDLTNNKLKHARWLVAAVVKFRQYQNGFFLLSHGLGKTFAIAKIGENRALVTSPEQRGEPATEGFFFEPENIANEVIQVERFLFGGRRRGMFSMRCLDGRTTMKTMSTMSMMRKARTRGMDPHKPWLRRVFLQGTARGLYVTSKNVAKSTKE